MYAALIPHVEISHWEDRSAAALILADGAAFGLWKKGKLGLHDGRGGDHVHCAFQIKPDEYEAYKRRIASAGLTPIEHQWSEGHRCLYFFDYDGIKANS